MQKNSQDFSMQEALRLAETPAGQQLLAMLQNTDNSLVQQAANAANAGDFTAASQSIQALLSTPEGKKLLDILRR